VQVFHFSSQFDIEGKRANKTAQCAKARNYVTKQAALKANQIRSMRTDGGRASNGGRAAKMRAFKTLTGFSAKAAQKLSKS